MSRQSQKTEVVNKINIRIGDVPRKRKRRKRTLKPKNQGGFQHSPSGAFRRRTPMFAPTPMRPVYDGWARENMPTFQGHVSPHKKKESTTAATQTTTTAATQNIPSTPLNQPVSSGIRETASPGALADIMAQSPGTIYPTHSPGGSSLLYSPASPIGTERLNRFNERRNPSRPVVPEIIFPDVPPVPELSPDPGSSPTNVSDLLAGLIQDEEQQISSPIRSSPYTPVQRNTGGAATPLRRARVNTDGFSLSFTGR